MFTRKRRRGPHTLEKLIGGTVNTKQINAHWEEILRLAASIQQGTVTASLMLRKLGAYPRQNALAIALREFGKLERTLFLLEYIRDVELRRRINLTGDYYWHRDGGLRNRKLRPLRNAFAPPRALP